jgi:hypothetical protein
VQNKRKRRRANQSHQGSSQPGRRTVYSPVLGAQPGRLGALGTPRKLAFTPLGPVRDAEASLDDAVGAACRRARAFRGLFFDSVGYE